MDGDDDRRLDAAVTLGIISAEQAAAIRALVPARPASAARPLTAATLGYVLGAITVLVAMGWFLADRWEWLGGGGVLAVAALYGALFLVVARRLRAEGYAIAAGVAALLAVLVVPVAGVALNELTGWFARPSVAVCQYPDFVFWACRGEELAVELMTLAAALVALRATRFSLLALPVAGILLRFVFHAASLAFGAGLGAISVGWIWVIAASFVAAAAYVTARRQRGDEDYALWLHLVAAFCAGIASTMLVGAFEAFRHLLVPGAFVAFAFSLRLRRFVWTILGMLWFVAYLGWLAGEVFAETPFFPIVLAALGIGVIIATVWVQRNSEMLVARFGGLSDDARPSFPGGVTLLLLPALVALLQIPDAAVLDRAERRANEATTRMFRARRAREANADPVAAIFIRERAREETRPTSPP